MGAAGFEEALKDFKMYDSPAWTVELPEGLVDELWAGLLTASEDKVAAARAESSITGQQRTGKRTQRPTQVCLPILPP